MMKGWWKYFIEFSLSSWCSHTVVHPIYRIEFLNENNDHREVVVR
jgi:hypothetical protein